MRLTVGTCGWQYRDWRGTFYPPGLPRQRWLGWYAQHFPVVEVDSTFYRLPPRTSARSWAEVVPPDFRFAVKMSRYATHIRRLQDLGEPVERFLDRLEPLGRLLDVVVLQLPPTLRCDVERLDAALARFPRDIRIAVEPRHASWFVDETRHMLTERGAALCLSDRRGRLMAPLWRTTSWGYVRLHEGRASPRPRYGRAALRSWLERLRALYGDGEPVTVVFNNDPGGAAVHNACQLLRLAQRPSGVAAGPP